MNAMHQLLSDLAPIITAATPVLLILVNWYVTSRQSKDLKKHSDENATKTMNAVSEATGTHQTLGDKGSGP